MEDSLFSTRIKIRRGKSNISKGRYSRRSESLNHSIVSCKRVALKEGRETLSRMGSINFDASVLE